MESVSEARKRQVDARSADGERERRLKRDDALTRHVRLALTARERPARGIDAC
jgi:hypothetical protein